MISITACSTYPRQGHINPFYYYVHMSRHGRHATIGPFITVCIQYGGVYWSLIPFYPLVVSEVNYTQWYVLCIRDDVYTIVYNDTCMHMRGTDRQWLIPNDYPSMPLSKLLRYTTYTSTRVDRLIPLPAHTGPMRAHTTKPYPRRGRACITYINILFGMTLCKCLEPSRVLNYNQWLCAHYMYLEL